MATQQGSGAPYDPGVIAVPRTTSDHASIELGASVKEWTNGAGLRVDIGSRSTLSAAVDTGAADSTTTTAASVVRTHVFTHGADVRDSDVSDPPENSPLHVALTRNREGSVVVDLARTKRGTYCPFGDSYVIEDARFCGSHGDPFPLRLTLVGGRAPHLHAALINEARMVMPLATIPVDTTVDQRGSTTGVVAYVLGTDARKAPSQVRIDSISVAPYGTASPGPRL